MSLSRKRMLTSVSIAGLVGGTAMALAQPAQADPFTNCTDRYACFWSGDGHTGDKWQFSGANANWADFGRSNQDNSMVNDGGTHAVRIFNYTGYSKSGGWMCVAKGVGWRTYPAPYGPNRTSSNNWYGGDSGYCYGA